MPLNPQAKLVMKKSAQEIQDQIFQKMSAEKSVHLASSFYHFAKVLNKVGEGYDGTRKVIKKNSRDSART